ncbi:MAG: hypothetical protein QNL04_05235 [SAR324 cluster bacterium]|nr:hypothetical protein [SAR324 cluster bacterium]
MKVNQIFKKKSILMLLVLWLIVPIQAHAAFWASATVPSGFSFSSSGEGLYSYDRYGRSSPTGQSFHAKVPFLPAFGVTQYKIDIFSADATAWDDSSSTLALDLVDVLFDFSTKNVNFLVGGGWGYASFTCGVTDCESYDFTNKEARQYMAMVGVPIGLFDFHLTAHRVFSKVLVETTDNKESLDFSGIFYGFGVRFGF